MDDPEVLRRMRADWNHRAGEDAYYYVAFGRRDQDDEEFFATATDVLRLLTGELKRLRRRDAALEIGCGPGRLMRPLSRHFAEIHGVDVSDEMIRLARERLRQTPNAHAHHTSGGDLALFPDGKFDFVYSYAVFQHIPSREVVLHYLREARRVLKTGGILRCQINGLPAHARRYDTWSGVRISAAEISHFAREHDFALLALEQVWTQYTWITCRKMPGGWSRVLPLKPRPAEFPCHIRNISNALTGERAAPATGPMAALSVWIDRLPADCDLNHMTMAADGAPCRLSYIGQPEADGVSQVNGALPEGIRTGLVPIELAWLGRALSPPAWVRIVPAGPSVPRIGAVTDGVNLLSGNRIASGVLKVTVFDLARADRFRASVDGSDVPGIESFCVDPVAQRWEFNVPLPGEIGKGTHDLRIALGRRSFAPVAIEVV
ncbi:MAG TPA: class I SAM-dependent methyltransferase [Bryobacteraceae bacterium]|nr:class I SAM-dependent methyltransferase [Bryobacteraceae bacterium]